jgi:hypothetical protein
MKIQATVTDQGIKREIDFQGATLPDGRPIQGILDENEQFKKDISNLEKELEEKSSIFSKIIPWKWARNILEIIMFVFGIAGIITLLL